MEVEYTGGALTLNQLHSVGVCVSYVWQSLSRITEQLLVGHQSGSQWIHSYQAASAQLAMRKPRLHAIGGPSKRQPMKSLVSNCLGSTQTPKLIMLMYKKKIGGENNYAASSIFYLHVVSSCFDWHSGIVFVSWLQAWNIRLTCKLKFEFHQCWIGKKLQSWVNF